MADQRALIGTSLDQVSTNAMLGTLAFQDADGAYIEKVRGAVALEALSKDIADTAVDVFVYDTRKDFDGGAWRKRTQHTSWYNETLNTATRGSRREFPAVAVIVATTSKVTIYDGDDPDLPMWMVFEVGRTPTVRILNWYTSGAATISSVVQLNGRLCVGTAGGATQFDFVEDAIYLSYNLSVAYTPVNNRISSRNDSTASNSGSSNEYFYFILSPTVNDVAMTVLPNAPIGSATGLPIPTIAVATNGGVSVIKDDGTVANYTRSGNEYTGFVAFDELNDLIISWGTSLGGYRHATRITNPFVGSTTLDTTYGYIASDLGMGGSAAGNTGGVVTVANSGRHFGIDFDSSSGVPATQKNHDDRVNFLHINDADTTKSLVAYATTSYNTGWMHGDIKGAFLSDTTVESLTANTNLASSATQAATSRLTSETYTNGATSWQMVDNAGNDNGYLAISFGGLTVGQTYHLSMTVDANAALDAGYQHKIEQGANIIYLNHWNGTGAGTLTTNFTAVSGTNALYFYVNAITVNVTNFNIRAVDDEDRSVNNNGLAVYGTITKSAVATGAELVSYGNFESNSAILVKPYDSGTQFGTGDFSISYWLYDNDNTQDVRHFCLNQDLTTTSETTEGFNIGTWNTNFRFLGVGGVTQTGVIHPNNVWSHIHLQRQSGTIYLYIDGILRFSTSYTGNVNASKGCTIGNTGYIGNGGPSIFGTHGKLSLVRLSASAPSAEQIKKIYEDEKVLFQENAKCTLYGTSDAVTALAYDETTSLLHVGTASGRSDFSGLKRINNTTTAVTTAISASNGLIAEQ